MVVRLRRVAQRALDPAFFPFTEERGYRNVRRTSTKPRLNRLFTMFPVLLYRQCSGKTAVQVDASFGSKDNLLSFTQSSPRDHGRTVLNLVLQAAEIFSGMEEQVRETEARAQSVCKSAEERVRLAEKRFEAAERARREIVNDAGRKLQEASKALTHAQARIVAAEDQVTALEFRAQSAEANLHQAKQALLQVEEAIRERLLSEKRSSVETQHDLASPRENG
jgi:hypothetical protein